MPCAWRFRNWPARAEEGRAGRAPSSRTVRALASPGRWQTEDQFSDGTLRLLGLLWAILEGGGPLLLEEPELSLHPEVVRFLPQMFARMQRRSGRQMIVSTLDSVELLRDEGIGLDEVLLLTPSPKGRNEGRRRGAVSRDQNIARRGIDPERGGDATDPPEAS